MLIAYIFDSSLFFFFATRAKGLSLDYNRQVYESRLTSLSRASLNYLLIMNSRFLLNISLGGGDFMSCMERYRKKYRMGKENR